MRCAMVLCFVISAAVANEKYTDKFDNVDMDEIMSNERLLTAYFECVMDRAGCTPEGKELKEHLKDAIETGCTKCTTIQENNSWKAIKYLIHNKKAMWDEATAKFDSTGKWRKEYEARAKAEGVEFP